MATNRGRWDQLSLGLAAPCSCCFLCRLLCHSPGETPGGTCSAVLLPGQNQKGANINISVGRPLTRGGWESEWSLVDPSGERVGISFSSASQSSVGPRSTRPRRYPVCSYTLGLLCSSCFTLPTHLLLFLSINCPPNYFYLVTGSAFGGTPGSGNQTDISQSSWWRGLTSLKRKFIFID